MSCTGLQDEHFTQSGVLALHKEAPHGIPQDFKEAARLAAEAKTKAAEADSELTKAEDLRARAFGLDAEERAAADRLRALEHRLSEAQRGNALASWRQLKVMTRLLCSLCQCRAGFPLLPGLLLGALRLTNHQAR